MYDLGKILNHVIEMWEGLCKQKGDRSNVGPYVNNDRMVIQ